MTRIRMRRPNRRGLVIVASIVATSSWFAAVSFSQDWNPRLAAEYLDARQEQWSVWPQAQSANGACVSCHTGMTYLLARPTLRRALGEREPTKYEVGLLNRLRSNVGAKPAAALRDVEVIFAALFLALQDASHATLSTDTQKAFDQLWALQMQDGATKGAWRWYSVDLDPWETRDSTYYGAALAALAVGLTPAEYRSRAETQAGLGLLTAYLRGAFETQPLHNRLAVLWASSTLPELLPVAAREAVIADVFKAQGADGGWTIDSLGPWQPHGVSPAIGSNSYATGFICYVLQEADIPPTDHRFSRALKWLRSRQDAKSGAWAADSMNKRYPPQSMQESFMQDAATAFATAALLNAQ